MSEMTMVERVARLVCKCSGWGPDELDDDHVAAWCLWEAEAREIIATMRQPNKRMIVAGETALDDCTDYDSAQVWSGSQTAIYKAMVDAALAETPGAP